MPGQGVTLEPGVYCYIEADEEPTTLLAMSNLPAGSRALRTNMTAARFLFTDQAQNEMRPASFEVTAQV